MGVRIHKGVARRPRRRIPRRDALTLAGNRTNISAIRPTADHHRVASNRRPTAPASSISPVEKTSKSGRGKLGGTIAIRSFLIGAKCAIAVKTNIVARAKRALAIHEPNTATPRAPNVRYNSSEPNKTIRTCIFPPSALNLECRPSGGSGPGSEFVTVTTNGSTQPPRPKLIIPSDINGCRKLSSMSF